MNKTVCYIAILIVMIIYPRHSFGIEIKEAKLGSKIALENCIFLSAGKMKPLEFKEGKPVNLDDYTPIYYRVGIVLDEIYKSLTFELMNAQSEESGPVILGTFFVSSAQLAKYLGISYEETSSINFRGWENWNVFLLEVSGNQLVRFEIVSSEDKVSVIITKVK